MARFYHGVFFAISEQSKRKKERLAPYPRLCITRSKPDPEVFLKAAEYLGLDVKNRFSRKKGRVAKFTFSTIIHEYRRGGACPSQQYNATIIKQCTAKS